jgi:hypothetical protein
MEERLAYYRKKYGEDFSYAGGREERPSRRSPSGTSAPKAREKEGGILKKISGLFKKKK